MQGSVALCSDFEAAADFLLLTAPPNANTNSTQKVPAVRGGGNNSNHGEVEKGPNTGV